MEFGFAAQRVTFYKGPLDYVLNMPSGDVGKYLVTRARRIIMAARRQVGVDSGRLKESIHYRQLRDSWGQYLWIGSEVNHAFMHHEGTKPHVIVPRNAPMLRFASGSRIVYTRHVNHPGTRPNRYLADQLYIVKI
jgi:hypothetical protein